MFRKNEKVGVSGWGDSLFGIMYVRSIYPTGLLSSVEVDAS